MVYLTFREGREVTGLMLLKPVSSPHQRTSSTRVREISMGSAVSVKVIALVGLIMMSDLITDLAETLSTTVSGLATGIFQMVP